MEKLIRAGRPKEQHTVGVDIPKGYGVQDGKYVKYDKDGKFTVHDNSEMV